MKILSGGSENFKTPERRALKICILQNQQEGGGGASKIIEPLARGGRGLVKFQASSFNIFAPPPPPPCHIK